MIISSSCALYFEFYFHRPAMGLFRLSSSLSSFQFKTFIWFIYIIIYISDKL